MTRKILAIAAFLTLGACGGGGADAPGGGGADAPEPAAITANPADALAEGLQQMTQALQQPGQSATMVPFERLMEMLTEPAGWTRSNHNGRQMTMGVTHSQAEADYVQGDVRVRVTVIDTSMSPMMIAPYSMFLASGFEERSSDGFTRSMTFEGSPGFEKWKIASTDAEVVVLVGKRFIVIGSSDSAPSVDVVKDLLRAAVNLSGLTSMQ